LAKSLLAKCLLAKFLFGQIPFGQMPSGKMPFGQIPFGQMPFGQILFGECFSTKKCEFFYRHTLGPPPPRRSLLTGTADHREERNESWRAQWAKLGQKGKTFYYTLGYFLLTFYNKIYMFLLYMFFFSFYQLFKIVVNW
jgi:hypothetical protein